MDSISTDLYEYIKKAIDENYNNTTHIIFYEKSKIIAKSEPKEILKLRDPIVIRWFLSMFKSRFPDQKYIDQEIYLSHENINVFLIFAGGNKSQMYKRNFVLKEEMVDNYHAVVDICNTIYHTLCNKTNNSQLCLYCKVYQSEIKKEEKKCKIKITKKVSKKKLI